VTGQQSVFNGTTRSLHQSILKTCGDKTKIEFIEVGGVANVLEEKVKPSAPRALSFSSAFCSFMLNVVFEFKQYKFTFR